MVSAKEEPDSSLPPAMDGLLRVHKRIVDGLEGDASHAPPGTGGKVSTRLLVAASQAGSLIGKQGGTVKSIQEASNCIVRVLGAGFLFMRFNFLHFMFILSYSVNNKLVLVLSHLTFLFICDCC